MQLHKVSKVPNNLQIKKANLNRKILIIFKFKDKKLFKEFKMMMIICKKYIK